MKNENQSNINFWQRFQEIRYDMSKANLEDVKNILNYYNQGSILIDGVNYHYNIDPMSAACLNARYYEFLGQNHPVFAEQAPKVIDELIKDKDILKNAGAYDSSYFDKLEQIKSGILQSNEEKNDIIDLKGKAK